MKKAIKFFEEEITRLENAPKINGCEMTDEWAEQIEICKTAKSALEKQIPKKPLKKTLANDCFAWEWVCPNCYIVKVTTEKQFCDNCGQAIDWSETE